MKKSKGMQLGAMLAAVLLVAIVFAGAAPTAPPDSVERAILGLNATEPHNEGLPDFGPEVFEKIKKDQKVLAIYGKVPTIKIETQKRNWLGNLDDIRKEGRKEMDSYFYPAGPVTVYGIDYEGYLVVMFNGSSNKVLMDKIYKLLDIQAMQRGITEVPVVFESGNLPQFDSLRTDYFRPIIGGVQVQDNLGIATLGFSAVDFAGNKGYVVSGHFAPSVGTNIYQPSSSNPTYSAGSVSRVGGTWADASWVPYSNVVGKIYIDETNIGAVNGHSDPSIGWWIYKSGIATGITTGFVLRKADVVPPNYWPILYDQYIADYNSANGDSGAPVYHYNTAGGREIVGTHSGTTGYGSERFFSPVTGVRYDLSVNPLTS